MRRGVGRVVAQGHLEGGAGLLELVARGQKHGQVVVGLGQFGVVLGQGHQHFFGLVFAVEFDQDARAHEPHLRISRLAGQVGLGAGQRLLRLAVAAEAVDFGVFIGTRRRCDYQQGA